ncbi:P-loop containing nucleoside triphosphate hydrolase protein [Mycena amicta]|nr:P-loop containing nucleoside triphosphate hydrolase protein [Mycena amicta]
MALSKDLRALGASKYLDLPSITVIGGQSAGKSSLVEAVSGITVPRDSGTCTRCPIECNMSSSATSWSCKISLRFDHSSQGVAREATTHSFGKPITERRDVEIWLRRAQAAILSPHLSPEDFYTKTEQELRDPDDQRLSFSKNAVVVEVNDPDITDLSFVDLPGLIQNDRVDVIEVVRELVVSRIQSDKTLILVTLPMNEDIQTQQAALLARNADANGERTIAVLTKADMLTAGALGLRETWKDVLEGRKEHLTHGYYCVRLPDDAERRQGLSRAACEQRAIQFFDSTEPWSKVADRTRFGVKNLATFLSQLLVERIELNLPILRQQLAGLIKDCADQLRVLPLPPSSDSTTEVLLRVNAFSTEFAAAVSGSGQKRLAQNCRRYYRQFAVDIRSTCPHFVPFLNVVMEGHDHSYAPPSEPQDYDLPTVTMDLPSADTAMIDSPSSSPRALLAFLPVSDALDLSDVRRVIQNSVAWELPTYTPFAATADLVGRFTKQWHAPALRCFNHIVDVSQDFLDGLTSRHFGQFSLLEDYIRTIVRAQIDQLKIQAGKNLEIILKLEATRTSTPLFTHNVNLFISETKKWHAHHLSRRYPESLRDPVRYQREIEEYAEELLLMSKVRAYWQIAYQRIIDYVPLLIEHEFNQGLVEGLQGALFEQLVEGSDVATRMQELLAENPQISAQRSSLQNRLERLTEIQRRLELLS